MEPSTTGLYQKLFSDTKMWLRFNFYRSEHTDNTPIADQTYKFENILQTDINIE